MRGMARRFNVGVLLVISATFVFSCGGVFVKLAGVAPEVLVGWRTAVPFVVWQRCAQVSLSQYLFGRI